MPENGTTEAYCFVTPMAFSGIYPGQRVIAPAGGLHGKAIDIH